MRALFHNAKSVEPIRVTLEEMGHPQRAMPIQKYNSPTEEIANNNIQKKVPSNGYVVLWGTIKIHQGHYNVFWKPGATNLTNYFTKHHPPHHHCHMRPIYLHCQDNSNNSIAKVCYSSNTISLK